MTGGSPFCLFSPINNIVKGECLMSEIQVKEYITDKKESIRSSK